MTKTSVSVTIIFQKLTGTMKDGRQVVDDDGQPDQEHIEGLDLAEVAIEGEFVLLQTQMTGEDGRVLKAMSVFRQETIRYIDIRHETEPKIKGDLKHGNS